MSNLTKLEIYMRETKRIQADLNIRESDMPEFNDIHIGNIKDTLSFQYLKSLAITMGLEVTESSGDATVDASLLYLLITERRL